MEVQEITLPDGSQGVRMYAYERIRGVAYSIDAWIPKGGKALYIRPTIENRPGNLEKSYSGTLPLKKLGFQNPLTGEKDVEI